MSSNIRLLNNIVQNEKYHPSALSAFNPQRAVTEIFWFNSLSTQNQRFSLESGFNYEDHKLPSIVIRDLEHTGHDLYMISNLDVWPMS